MCRNIEIRISYLVSDHKGKLTKLSATQIENLSDEVFARHSFINQEIVLKTAKVFDIFLNTKII